MMLMIPALFEYSLQRHRRRKADRTPEEHAKYLEANRIYQQTFRDKLKQWKEGKLVPSSDYLDTECRVFPPVTINPNFF